MILVVLQVELDRNSGRTRVEGFDYGQNRQPAVGARRYGSEFREKFYLTFRLDPR